MAVTVQARPGKSSARVLDTGIGISDDAKTHISIGFIAWIPHVAEGTPGLGFIAGYVDLMAVASGR